MTPTEYSAFFRVSSFVRIHRMYSIDCSVLQDILMTSRTPCMSDPRFLSNRRLDSYNWVSNGPFEPVIVIGCCYIEVKVMSTPGAFQRQLFWRQNDEPTQLNMPLKLIADSFFFGDRPNVKQLCSIRLNYIYRRARKSFSQNRSLCHVVGDLIIPFCWLKSCRQSTA